jgi:hypothetical protein
MTDDDKADNAAVNGNMLDTASEPLPGLTREEIEEIERTNAALEKSRADFTAAAVGTMGQEKAEAFLDATLLQFVGIGLRGLMVSTGGLPPDVILRSYARVFAKLIGEAMAGDIVPVFKARATIKETFLTALKAQPVKPAPPPARPAFRQQQQG